MLLVGGHRSQACFPMTPTGTPFFLSILCVNKDFCFLTLQPCILQPDLVNLNTAVPWKNHLDVGAYRLPTDDRLSINNLVSAVTETNQDRFQPHS